MGEAPRPIPTAGEVLLKVLRCALCGSELRLWKNGAEVTPGHEIVGVVDAPGHALHGHRVLVYIPIFCGRCPSCRAGDTHVCLQSPDLIGWQRPGGYAEFLVVPERCLLPLPEDIPTTLAALLLDTVGTVAHAVRLAKRVVAKGTVAVLGAGPMGLGAVIAFQGLGFADIWCAEPGETRREKAALLGARPLPVGSRERQFDLVVESSGSGAARQQALEIVAPGGACLLLGESDAWDIRETKTIRRKDFFIIRSFYFPVSRFNDNLALLRASLDRYRLLADREGPLEDLGGLFEAFARGEVVKPQVAFSP